METSRKIGILMQKMKKSQHKDICNFQAVHNYGTTYEHCLTEAKQSLGGQSLSKEGPLNF